MYAIEFSHRKIVWPFFSNRFMSEANAGKRQNKCPEVHVGKKGFFSRGPLGVGLENRKCILLMRPYFSNVPSFFSLIVSLLFEISLFFGNGRRFSRGKNILLNPVIKF